MLINFLKKFGMGVLIGLMLITANASAQEGEADETTSDVATEVDGDQSLLRCAVKGEYDFSNFLDAVIFSDGFFEGVIEPWIDVVSRNRCQAVDVQKLVRQQDKVREAVRAAYLNCDAEKIPALEKRHHQLTAEIYYVRHIVDSDAVANLPDDFMREKSMRALIITDRDKLYKDMKERYVSADFLSQEDFDELFLRLETKYTDRVDSYILCEEGVWQEVEKRWDSFKKYYTDDLGGIVEFGEVIGKKGELLGREIEKTELVQLLTTDKGIEEYLGSFVEGNLNAIGFEETLLEDLEAIGRNLEGSDLAPQDVLEVYSSSVRKHDILSMEAEMRAYYKVLYGEASDGSVKLFMEGLNEPDGLKPTIEDGFPLIDRLIQGTEIINDRQCPD